MSPGTVSAFSKKALLEGTPRRSWSLLDGALTQKHQQTRLLLDVVPPARTLPWRPQANNSDIPWRYPCPPVPEAAPPEGLTFPYLHVQPRPATQLYLLHFRVLSPCRLSPFPPSQPLLTEAQWPSLEGQVTTGLVI
jgi:hypothetical protein